MRKSWSTKIEKSAASKTAANDNHPTTTTTTQTVRINGKRTRLVTRNGRVTAKVAPPLEHELQAAQVRRLRGMGVLFAGDQNAAKRGPKAQAIARATGMAPGEPDLRVYLAGGFCGFIENKVGNGRLSPAQVQRHADLRRLGFVVEVVRAMSEDEAADKAETVVRGWLADNELTVANENNRTDAVKVA